jgi:hypothetical protein
VRTDGLLTRVRPHLALGGLLALGVALRVWLIYSDRPGFLGSADVRTYLAAVHGPLFGDAYKPAGYSAFLRVLRAVLPSLEAAINVQHVLGLVAAVLLYLAVRPYLRRRWLALLPAAVVLLGGAELYLEHSALSDAPFAFLVAAAVWCAGRTTDQSPRSWVWLAGAGVFVGAGVALRPVGLALLPVVMGWPLARRWPVPRLRWLTSAAALGGTLLILVPYLVAQHQATGAWGLTRLTGVQFFGRVATFADCRDFTPPPGTEALCPHRPASQRPNANWYLFALQAPLQRYPLTSSLESELSQFDRSAMLAQPLDFIATTVEGMAKYIAPHLGPGSMLDVDNSGLVSALQNREIEAFTAPYVQRAYGSPVDYTRHSLSALNTYARDATIEGPLTAIFLVLMIAGLVMLRGRARTFAWLLFWVVVALAVTPVAALFYSARYAVPMYGPLAAAAALGMDAGLARVRPV